jgi:hypothetical protein
MHTLKKSWFPYCKHFAQTRSFVAFFWCLFNLLYRPQQVVMTPQLSIFELFSFTSSQIYLHSHHPHLIICVWQTLFAWSIQSYCKATNLYSSIFSNPVVDNLNQWFTHVSNRVYFASVSNTPLETKSYWPIRVQLTNLMSQEGSNLWLAQLHSLRPSHLNYPFHTHTHSPICRNHSA